MLDAAVTMGAVAASTNTLKLGTSVLIVPYRNPLSDARQFATVDALSNGRLILGVGAGWMKEEFDALGLSYAERGAMANECIEIFKRSWTTEVVDFHGRFYNFDSVSMDPKPVKKPRPPIIFGGVVPAGARRAARYCDGFYPIFLDPQAEPKRFAPLLDEIRREAGRLGRDLSKGRTCGGRWFSIDRRHASIAATVRAFVSLAISTVFRVQVEAGRRKSPAQTDRGRRRGIAHAGAQFTARRPQVHTRECKARAPAQEGRAAATANRRKTNATC
jgi:probable F420-dependent oxidoreductase